MSRKTKKKPIAPTIRQRPANTTDSWVDPLWQPSSDLERQFGLLWVELYPGIDLHAHYKFCPDRRFEFDFCHIPTLTAIEVQGGIHASMGHSTGSGIQRDMEKTQLAASMGWLVIPVSARDVGDAQVLGHIAKTIRHRMEAVGAA